MKKGFIFLTFIFFLNLCCLFGESNWSIDFYGVSSEDLDKNMAEMTSDLYYTQLCEIKNFSVSDKRDAIPNNTIPEKDLFSNSNLSFYTVISKKPESSKWLATMHIYNKNSDSELTSTKEFDSYYKILMEGKQELKESFISLIQNHKSGPAKVEESSSIPEPSFTPTIKASTENLAGTWQGEQNIEKILIMRGGRGFVIFKNGASMNISIKIEGSTIIISQTGKANASFFPDLPRQQALEAALTAEPITWKLQMTADNTLEGIKNTLLADGDSIQSGNIDVKWSRKL